MHLPRRCAGRRFVVRPFGAGDSYFFFFDDIANRNAPALFLSISRTQTETRSLSLSLSFSCTRSTFARL